MRGGTLRVPQIIHARAKGEDQITFERYDDREYGYLRVLATAQQLRIEYHPAGDGTLTKSPDDSVTVSLRTRKRVNYKARNLGYTFDANEVRQLATDKNSMPSQPTGGAMRRAKR